MASSVTRTSSLSSSFPRTLSRSTNSHRKISIPQFQLHRTSPIQASRRISNFPQEGNNLVDDRPNWSRNRGVVIEEYDDDDQDEDDDDEEEEEDRSLDLLVRFVQNVFKKISKKARKAVRSVLPLNISTKLVGFSVNGVIILAFLWVLKAFLEVICTLGSVVFVSILLVRGIWAGVSYLQESRNLKVNEFDAEHHAWTGTRPAT
ncbi:protein SHORT HYPOCOTYL IN WHITE LIGHT 1-like [Cornus florida]|uniref:protein SHORT HYPOCOTYL IN WHITE LIGHT 1-like n=1 Tax=Cornus florida TaxID=4283 RepID=UPI002899A65C|nr:protein SHORT HYPOCOTYL IN WHITE LIGHT 1-like [Cornus florida]